jgi:hypothetical protein
MTEKRKFNPLFPTLIKRAGERPTYFKMAKNVKSLIIIFLHAIVVASNYAALQRLTHGRGPVVTPCCAILTLATVAIMKLANGPDPVAKLCCH